MSKGSQTAFVTSIKEMLSCLLSLWCIHIGAKQVSIHQDQMSIIILITTTTNTNNIIIIIIIIITIMIITMIVTTGIILFSIFMKTWSICWVSLESPEIPFLGKLTLFKFNFSPLARFNNSTEGEENIMILSKMHKESLINAPKHIFLRSIKTHFALYVWSCQQCINILLVWWRWTWWWWWWWWTWEHVSDDGRRDCDGDGGGVDGVDEWI